MPAEPATLLRRLRIAWTAVSAAVGIFLLMLWLRSHWWVDEFNLTLIAREFMITSADGEAELEILAIHDTDCGWEYSCRQWDALQREYHYNRLSHNSLFGFGYEYSDDPDIADDHILLPIWFLCSSAFACAAIPWLPRWSRRFSLRTLLIATTLLALGLGLLVCGPK